MTCFNLVRFSLFLFCFLFFLYFFITRLFYHQAIRERAIGKRISLVNDERQTKSGVCKSPESLGTMLRGGIIYPKVVNYNQQSQRVYDILCGYIDIYMYLNIYEIFVGRACNCNYAREQRRLDLKGFKKKSFQRENTP